MAKTVWTFTFIVVGMMLLLAMAGVVTPSSTVLKTVFGMDTIEDNANPMGSTFFSQTLYYIGLIAAAAVVVIGIFGRQTITDTIAGMIATYVLFAFVGDMMILIQIADSYATWAGNVIKLLILPLCFGYIAAMFDWVRGRD